jgi:glycerophosphoryl diester phosphodiesterase
VLNGGKMNRMGKKSWERRDFSDTGGNVASGRKQTSGMEVTAMSVKRIAHRGFSSEAPENSLASFAMAVEGEFYGVECDIWKCLDGDYVVSHDGSLGRMYGLDKNICDLTYEQMRRHPMIRGRKRANHPPQYPALFTSYLAILARVEHCHPLIELKMDYTTVELREIVLLVEKYGLYERTYFISLYPSVLLRLKKELEFPSSRLQYVYGATKETKFRPVGMELEQWLMENRINLDTRYNLLSAGNVMRLHEAGLLVNVWTVNCKSDFIYMVNELGVDMVTTEYFW